MKVLKYFFLILTLFYFNTLNAEERDNKLNRLFNDLKIDNIAQDNEVEQKIWEIWSTHPTDQFLTSRLAEGSRFVRNNQLLKAIDIFTEVIKKDPSWAF